MFYNFYWYLKLQIKPKGSCSPPTAKNLFPSGKGFFLFDKYGEEKTDQFDPLKGIRKKYLYIQGWSNKFHLMSLLSQLYIKSSQ